MKTLTKTADETAVAMQRELLENAHDINNVLTAGNVSPVFQGHIFDMENGKHGIENAIIAVLTEREAIFPKGTENSKLRPVVIAAGMFTKEIFEAIQVKFAAGTTRYPLNTIEHYLSVVMSNHNTKTINGNGKIGFVKLTNAEDKPRPCYRPRKKWYLVE